MPRTPKSPQSQCLHRCRTGFGAATATQLGSSWKQNQETKKYELNLNGAQNGNLSGVQCGMLRLFCQWGSGSSADQLERHSWRGMQQQDMDTNAIQYHPIFCGDTQKFQVTVLESFPSTFTKRCGSNNDSAAVLPFQYRIFERAPPWKGSSSLSSNRSFHLTASFQNWKISRIYKQKVPLGCWAIPSSILWFWNEILYPVIYIYFFLCVSFSWGFSFLDPCETPYTSHHSSSLVTLLIPASVNLALSILAVALSKDLHPVFRA